ncbi:MAG: hypothetical protein IT423_10650 [Pirellulaceae bacterium]|nr:hypothetical protein [Pirellulaceae bacterium]
MQSQSKWPTFFIVALTLAIVFGPVFVPREAARWYLAAAHNAFRQDDPVSGNRYLEKAAAWDPSIRDDGDYWIAQLPTATVDQTLDLIEKALTIDDRWASKAQEAAEHLAEMQDFTRAVRALKIANFGQRPTNPKDLNHLAYMRAMAIMELDEALKDIDKAIDEVFGSLDSVLQPTLVDPTYGNIGMYLDTKAWVLHGLNRHLEALGWMNWAIKSYESEMVSRGYKLPDPLEAELSDDELSDAGLTDAELSDALATDAQIPDTKAPDGQALDEKTLDDKTLDNQVGRSPRAPSTSSDSKRMGEVDQGTEGLDAILSDMKTSTIQAAPSSFTAVQSEIAAAQQRLGVSYTLAIMRFHRLRILEALGWSDQAAEDRKWLAERGVPIVDELY